jgi:hypothetical protein
VSTGEKVVLGVGGAIALYLLWKSYTSAPAQQVAPATAGGNSISSMTPSAARNTVFSVLPALLGGIRPPAPPAKPVPQVSIYASPGAVQRAALASAAPVNQSVAAAAFAPLTVTPAPNANRYSATGILSMGGLQPGGNIPRPIMPAGVS